MGRGAVRGCWAGGWVGERDVFEGGGVGGVFEGGFDDGGGVVKFVC